MAESAFTLEQDHSVLGHTAASEADYGTALCWAENAVGAQKAPCAFREGRRTRQVVTKDPRMRSSLPTRGLHLMRLRATSCFSAVLPCLCDLWLLGLVDGSIKRK